MRLMSSSKILLLWIFLKEDKFTKQQLLEKFAQNEIQISKRTLDYYLSKLKKYEEIKVQIKGKKTFYYIENPPSKLVLDKKDKLALLDIKNLLKLEKNYKHIKEAIKLFLKISLYIEDFEERSEFLYFNYYSTLNWFLVKELEKHCKNKDIIEIDYILPYGANKFITIHADEICQSMTSERLYLKGFLEFSDHFSILPIDRIFKIEKVVRKNARYEKIMDISTYVTSKEKFEELGLDEKENIYGEKNGRIIIKRPKDDDFYLSQRLFNFCPDLFYISDNKIKKEIEEKLKTMKETYEEQIDF